MTNDEIMLADSEYWAGTMSGAEFLTAVGFDAATARIAYLETEYGRFLDSDGHAIDTGEVGLTRCMHRSWFSLLIAAAETPPLTLKEEMIKAWPFPVVNGLTQS